MEPKAFAEWTSKELWEHEPIAEAPGMRFTWKWTPAGHDHIQLVKVACGR